MQFLFVLLFLSQAILARGSSEREQEAQGICPTCGSEGRFSKHLKEVASTVSGQHHGCNLARVAANARKNGWRTDSMHQCLPFARRAYAEAGCSVPEGYAHSAPYAWKHLQGKWHCSRSSARSAPDGASIFYVGCGSHHTEIKSGNCFYSDFHDPDCRPASEFSCGYKTLGWCYP